MTVAVIIPAYNAERTLKRTLESVFAQTVTPNEIIVIDDGSFDGTASLARSLGVTVIEQENAGPSAARNNGVRAATSEIIFLLDADDTWAPNKIEEHLKVWKSGHPGLVYDWAQRIRHNGTWGGVGGKRSTNRVQWTELLSTDNWTCGSSYSYRRSDWLEIGGFKENIRFAEDVEFMIRYSHRFGDAHCILESLTTYWLGVNSASNVPIDPSEHYEKFREALPFLTQKQGRTLFSAFAIHQMMQAKGLKFLRVPMEALPVLVTKPKFYRSVALKSLRVILGHRFTYLLMLLLIKSPLIWKGATILAHVKVVPALLALVIVGHRTVNRHQLFIYSEGKSRVRVCPRSSSPMSLLFKELDMAGRYVVIPAGHMVPPESPICGVLSLRPFSDLRDEDRETERALA
jgi:glycosyltransferase involved in cell wall biosynthesis